MPDSSERLSEISERLDEAARALRSPDVDAEAATRLAGECADLAAAAAAELERLARRGDEDAPAGQEELL